MDLKNKGFSIAEVMIAMGLLGGLSYALMKMTSDSAKTQKNLQAKDSMSQLQREITTHLASEQNCSVSLRDRSQGSSVPILYKATNTGTIDKYIAGGDNAPEIGNTKIGISSMSVLGFDLNGDGSNASVNLKVVMRKLDKNAIGGKNIPFDIKLSANLCKINLLIKSTLKEIQDECAGDGKKITGGLKQWEGKYWASCQDCSGVNNSATAVISTCQSMGLAGGGVDTNNLSKISCLNMGGVFDDNTNSCNFDGKDIPTLISGLQSQIDAAKVRECKLEDKVNILNGKMNKTNICGNTPAIAQINKSQSWSSSGVLSLGKYYVPGSLQVKVIGGGGGGAGANLVDGGNGGGAAALQQGTLTGVTTSQTCTVIIGHGGSGGSPGANSGATGGPTSITCSGGSLASGGGGGGHNTGGDCEGEAGAGTIFGAGGGKRTSCGMGYAPAGGAYGAGGGGGSCKGAGCGKHSGASGASGYAEASWKEYDVSAYE